MSPPFNARMTAFMSCALEHGELADLRQDDHPSILSGWVEDALRLVRSGTHFGIIYAGPAVLRCSSGAFTLGESWR